MTSPVHTTSNPPLSTDAAPVSRAAFVRPRWPLLMQVQRGSARTRAGSLYPSAGAGDRRSLRCGAHWSGDAGGVGSTPCPGCDVASCGSHLGVKGGSYPATVVRRCWPAREGGHCDASPFTAAPATSRCRCRSERDHRASAAPMDSILHSGHLAEYRHARRSISLSSRSPLAIDSTNASPSPAASTATTAS